MIEIVVYPEREEDAFDAVKNPEVKKNLELLDKLVNNCSPEEFVKKVSKEFNVPEKNLKKTLKNFQLNGQPVV